MYFFILIISRNVNRGKTWEKSSCQHHYFLIIIIIISFQPTQAQWRIVFFIAAGIYVACGSVYLLFSSGKRQKWDDPSMDKINEEKKSKKNGLKLANGDNTEETGQ